MLAPSSHAIPAFWCSAMITPPTIVTGAASSMLHPITTSICTCWTSFVTRVISDAGPKWLTSRAENASDRWNRFARTSRPNPDATRAP